VLGVVVDVVEVVVEVGEHGVVVVLLDVDVDVEVGAVLVGEHGSVVDVVLVVDELLDGLVGSGSGT
jgi:hypothetical protein